MSQYFPKPYKPFGGDINVQVDFFNYDAKISDYDEKISRYLI